MGHPNLKDIIEMFQKGPKNTKKNIENTFSSIEKIIQGFNQEDIIYWLSALSIIPGNEMYQKRLEFLIQTVLSHSKKINGGKKVTKNIIKKLLNETNNLNWIMFEDWMPIKLDSKRQIFFRNKFYSFFPNNFEFPEASIEKISSFYSLNDQFKKEFGYYPLDELKQLLSYQDDIINIIFTTDIRCSIHQKIQIPQKDFVYKWKKYLSNKKTPFSKNFSKRISIKDIIKPSSFFLEKQSEILKHPIYKEKIFLPSELLESLSTQILKDYKKISSSKNEKILKTHLKRNVLLSFLEIVSLPDIFLDFKINDINKKIDFGIIHDDKFFIFYILDKIDNKHSFNINLEKVQRLCIKLKNEFDNKKIQIDGHEIPDNLEPIFIFIFDDSLVFEQIIIEKNIDQFLGFILSASCLRHIFEDLADQSEDLTFFVKILKKYNDLRKENILLHINFCDFYERMKMGVLPPKGGIIFIDPHSYSDTIDEKISKRPRMDLTPYVEYPPFTFRVKKLGENEYYGSNLLMDQFFLAFIEQLQIYFWFDIKLYPDQSDIDTGLFLSQFYMYILKHINLKILVKNKTNKKIVIKLIPIKTALENKICLNKNIVCQCLISSKDRNEMAIIYNVEKIIEKVQGDLDAILIPFFIIIQELYNIKSYDEIIDIILDLNLNKKFNITKAFHYMPVDNVNNINYPTIIDEVDVDKIIFDFIKQKYKDGIYYKKEANEIIKNIASYFEKLIIKKLYNYDLEYFIKLAYSENEKVIITRTKNDMEYLRKKGMMMDYDPIKIVQEQEEKNNWYAPCCRYLIETSLSLKYNGKKIISLYEWKELVALTKKYLDLISLSDFFYLLSIRANFLDIKLEINTANGLIFNPIFKNNPFKEFFKEMIESRSTANFEEEYPQNIDEVKAEDVLQNGYKLLDSKIFRDIDYYLQEHFGFKQLEYGIVLNAITYMQDYITSNYIVQIKKEEMVDFLHNKVNLSESIISNILDFSTLTKNSYNDLPLYGKLSTRSNRLTVKPLIKINDMLIFGISTVVTVATIIQRQLINGNWPYSYENIDFPIDLKNKLITLNRKTSSEFENAVFQSISKYTKLIEKNVCKNPGENDKCLKYVCEPCIGEIDVFSLHPKSKTAILWEAKNIEKKFGSKEISYDVEEFLSEKKGYLIELKNKQNYIKRNLTNILHYYNINETDDWKVESVFVFSSLSILKFIISQHHPSILWDEIESYLKMKNCL